MGMSTIKDRLKSRGRIQELGVRIKTFNKDVQDKQD
jgi:hypothetical protein